MDLRWAGPPGNKIPLLEISFEKEIVRSVYHSLSQFTRRGGGDAGPLISGPEVGPESSRGLCLAVVPAHWLSLGPCPSE